MSTLTYVYEDSTAVLGPLARTSEPHTYDLCQEHAARLTAPRGWELLRVAGSSDASDDLVALADAVHPRRRSRPEHTGQPAPTAPSARTPARHGSSPSAAPDRGRHLRVVRSTDD